MTIREAFEEFERSRRLKGRGDRTLKDYRSQMERYVFPKWGRTPVDRLTRPEVASLHDRIRATGLKARGNRVLATISSLYGWLQRERDYKGVNPATGIERTQEHGRDTFLQPDQVARLKTALQEYAEDVGGRSRNNDVAADAIWFCLVTGARSGEVKRATWDQFDPALSVWVKPASTTKQRKLHRVPLSPGAQEVLLRRRGLARPGETHVFPSQLGDKLIALRYAWETVTRSAGLDGVRIHDLRHSYASLAISAGVPLTVVGGLLGHAVPATTARYVHLIDNDLRAAVGRVNAVIDRDSK